MWFNNQVFKYTELKKKETERRILPSALKYSVISNKIDNYKPFLQASIISDTLPVAKPMHVSAAP